MTREKLYGNILVTYRCNARCNMCNCWQDPTKPQQEFKPELIRKLPQMEFASIAGGEPFIRPDFPEIIEELYKKAKRIVVPTNGYFTDRILTLCDRFPNIGIRISLEGLEEMNNKIRGIPDGWKRGYNTLKTLIDRGHPDIGFGMTVQDMNCHDLVPLYKISEEMCMEFATCTPHNSFYFRKTDNYIADRYEVCKCFEDLINVLLKSKSPKKWFRAYFNHGLINYIYGQPRLLPCEMAKNSFFLDPFGDVIPCNGSREKMIMGNLYEMEWEELWNSARAKKVRDATTHCDRQCWMTGSASPVMHKYMWVPGWWIIKHKLFMGNKYRLEENEFVQKAMAEDRRAIPGRRSVSLHNNEAPK
jgi:Predicted Fe-S oxidoreductases